MPRFRYVGTTELRLDQGTVAPGDIVEASGPPSKNFVPVEEAVAEPTRRRGREIAQPIEREEESNG